MVWVMMSWYYLCNKFVLSLLVESDAECRGGFLEARGSVMKWMFDVGDVIGAVFAGRRRSY